MTAQPPPRNRIATIERAASIYARYPLRLTAEPASGLCPQLVRALRREAPVKSAATQVEMSLILVDLVQRA